MENSIPFCKPESNPAGLPPVAVKYTQGSWNEPCVTELEVEPLHIHEHCKEDNSGKLLLREKERHGGAITCRQVGRVIGELTIWPNLNLRKS